MKNNKSKINKKEIIVTVVVLILAILIGFIAGKALFDVMHK